MRAQQAHRVEIRCRGQPVFLRDPPGHAQLATGQPLAPDGGDLGIDAAGAKSELLKLEPVPERSGAKILEGSTRDRVVELVRILREEEKVL